MFTVRTRETSKRPRQCQSEMRPCVHGSNRGGAIKSTQTNLVKFLNLGAENGNLQTHVVREEFFGTKFEHSHLSAHGGGHRKSQNPSPGRRGDCCGSSLLPAGETPTQLQREGQLTLSPN